MPTRPILLLVAVAVLFAGTAAVATPPSGFVATLRQEASGELTLRWPSETGMRYFIETAGDLKSWTPLPDGFVGTGTELGKVVRPAATESMDRQFWRVSAFSSASAAPILTTQPVAQTVAAGWPATFSIVAAGPGPLTYQWRKDGVDLPGATGSSYTTLPLTSPADAGAYSVVVRNVGGVIVSEAAPLAVLPNPIPVGLWTFDNPADLLAPLYGNRLAAFGATAAAVGPALGDGAIILGPTTHLGLDHGIAANGGGTTVNQWTMVMDLRVPALGAFNSLFQTNPANTDDGDCFLNAAGNVGVGLAGYSAPSLKGGRWYRLVVAVDNAHRYDVYLDGQNVLRGQSGVLDGRFALLSRLLVGADEDGERMEVDLATLAIYGQALSDAEVAALGGFAADSSSSFLTLPYLQNVKTDAITIMWETDLPVADSVEYGTSAAYGTVRGAVNAASGANTTIHKVVLTDLQPGTTYHYRVNSGGQYTTDQTFRTAPATAVDFSFGVWGDSQGATDNPADRNEPTNSFMRHMVETEHVDLAVTTGDLAESGYDAGYVWPYFIERPVRIVGEHVPFFVAWGNHDGDRGSLIRKYTDLPSKDRGAHDPGYGSYSFDYAGCHFICIDYYTARADVVGWVRDDLQSPSAKAARFIFAFIHTPPWCERWYAGDGWLGTDLVPYLEQAGAAVLFSGHMHAYERGIRNGVAYVTNGGGSWLDTGEPLVHDWPHITVGGYSNVPSAINHGLVNEYVKVEVAGDTCTVRMKAFNLDGSFLGELDTFQITARPAP
ncbi:MAG: fibronectin type III domain-containing protein [Opitutaceae bacterium]|nr:fibronectin type III domain-containing protein [Opitutaceae bacterium]